MSGREHIRKKSRSPLNSTSVPNPLQRRRLKAPPQIQSGLSQQQNTSSIPEQLDRASQFNHNFLDVPVEALQTAQPSPPIQAKVDVGGVGNQEQGEIAIANPGESQEQDFSAEEQTVEQEQTSAGEGTENQDAPDSNQEQEISDREQESEVVQRQSETSQAQVEKDSRFNHNFLEVPVNTPGAIPTPIQRSVNFSNLGDSYPQENVSVVDPVKNSLNLFKAQTIQREENVEGEDLEHKSETEDEPIQKKDVFAIDPVRNSLNLFKAQTIQRKESAEAEELEQQSETEDEPIQKKDVSTVDPVRNSLNLLKAQTVQRKENVEGEELEQESETEGEPIQKKGAKNISFHQGENKPENKERQKLLAPKFTDTVQQNGAIAAKSITQVANKANKLQAKEQITVSETKQVIQRRENPNPEKGAGNQPQPAQAAPVAQPAAPVAPAGGGGAASAAPTVAAVPTAAGGGGAVATQGRTQQATSGGAAGGSPGASGGKTPTSPQQDPGFQAAVNKTKGVAQDKKKHDPAQAESKEAQDAAQPPANEVESKAQDKQVQEMNQQQPGTFNAEAFKRAVMEKVDQTAPKTLEDADKFKDSNLLSSVSETLSTQAKDAAKEAAGPVEDKTKEAPDTSGIKPKEVKPLEKPEAGAKPPDIGAAQATPKPKPETEVSAPMKAESQKLDQQMAEGKVTEEQLAKSNEPQFLKAVGAKKDAQTKAVEAPQEYRQQEQATLNQAQTEAQTTSQTQLEEMHGQREQLLTQVTGKQDETKTKDEQERTKIANDIDGIYQNTKKDVEGILDGLDKEVTDRFKVAGDTAKKKFEEYVAPYMKEYMKRYEGPDGLIRWGTDKLFGVPPEVTAFFDKGRNLYRQEMDTALTGIANYVAEQLNKAKQKIDEGRQKIQEYVKGLPEGLQQIGTEAAQNIQSKFDELEQSVKDKETQLVDTLAQQYTENLQQLDAQIDEMKASNQPWFAQAFDAMAGAIDSINKLKDMLMGVLAKAASALDKIILDPIGFLGNLISGIRQGLDNFVTNIMTHLQTGLIGWLTGAMGGLGIQLPDDIFSLQGIFSLVTQILGLTWDYIRSKAVKMFTEPVVAGMEQTVEIFQIIANKGPMGLWEQVQEQFGDLKETVIEEIKSMLITQVITAGVKWIIGLLNPASAFVKAAMAIYDIVMFFINQGSQVMELVNAITDAVVQIASGAVGGAAKLVENALAKSLPVAIGFLASLLGIGDLAKKVQDIVKKVRDRIDQAIDKVLQKAKSLFKGNKGKKGKDKEGEEGEPDERTKEEKEADLGKALNKSTQLMRESDATPDSIKAKLPAIQSAYKLTSLELVKTGDTTYHVEGKVNPENKTPDITLSQANEDWEKAWKAKQEEVQSKMQQFIPRFQALDSKAEVHVKGSLASGVKLNPKKRSPSGEPYVFNPTDFDIDAYVKSDALYRQALQNGAVVRKPGEIVGSKSKIPGFNEIIWDMRKELAQISGNRDVGEEMFRFNVFIRTDENVSSSIKRDQKLAGNIDQDASIGNPLIIKDPKIK